MSEAFIGEIRMLSFPWAPRGWMLCNGGMLPVDQNQALYSLYFGTFGASADRKQFGVPDLRGRTPVFANQQQSPFGIITQGAKGGAETISLTTANLPSHNHAAEVVSNPTVPASMKPIPTGRIPTDVANDAQGRIANYYDTAPSSASVLVPLNPATIGSTGSPTPTPGHPNMQPFTVVNFCVATTGYYPPRD
ncbi:MAG: tail fiber protein [Rhodospirillaceae bacterium]